MFFLTRSVKNQIKLQKHHVCLSYVVHYSWYGEQIFSSPSYKTEGVKCIRIRRKYNKEGKHYELRKIAHDEREKLKNEIKKGGKMRKKISKKQKVNKKEKKIMKGSGKR